MNCDDPGPPVVSGASGTEGQFIEMDGPAGGNTSIATTGTGGDGGQHYLTSGRGGTAPNAAVAATGGNGGRFFISANPGGSASGAANVGTNLGGNGGTIQLLAREGGNAANGTSNTGGNGGPVIIQLGSGGTGSTANGADGILRVQRGQRANSDIQRWESYNGAAILLKINSDGSLVADSASIPPAVSGCTAAAIVAGSTALAGQINTTPTGTCAVTLTFTTAAPHGYNCAISNQTTANLIRQTASTTTTAVFTGVTVANDVLAYGPCVGW